MDTLIEKEVIKVLKEIDVCPDWLGFKYIITAIKLMINNKNDNFKIGEIYKDVAKKHRTTYSKVERNIRYTKENIKINLNQYFETKHKVTNSSFLYFIKNKVLMSIMEQQVLPKNKTCIA